MQHKIDYLIALLEDKDKEVCFEAAYQLGKSGNKKAINPLIASLKNKKDRKSVV